jgi:hypothetical protein
MSLRLVGQQALHQGRAVRGVSGFQIGNDFSQGLLYMQRPMSAGNLGQQATDTDQRITSRMFTVRSRLASSALSIPIR